MRIEIGLQHILTYNNILRGVLQPLKRLEFMLNAQLSRFGSLEPDNSDTFVSSPLKESPMLKIRHKIHAPVPLPVVRDGAQVQVLPH